jgi:hypothetical protein
VSSPTGAKGPQKAAEQVFADPRIPNDVKYTIIKTNNIPDIKRQVDVRLNHKVSAEVLSAIAVQLKNADHRVYERTFILYYLPGMEVNSGAWATTDFDSDLQVHILGASIAQEDALVGNDVNRVGQPAVGRWMLEYGALNGTIRIYRENGKSYIEINFKDGSNYKTEVSERSTPSGRRFEAKIATGDYYVINRSGNLQVWDREGLVTTAIKI